MAGDAVAGESFMRRCQQCGVDKSLAEFGINRARPDGLQGRCLVCLREVSRQRYWADPEAARRARRDWAQANPEKVRATKRETVRRNPEKVQKRLKDWKQANLDKVREHRRASAARNRAHIREYRRAYYQRNAARINSQKGRRRARKLGNGVVDIIDRRVVFARGNGICGICGFPVDSRDFHVDHIVPLLLGGEESYANTQPAHPRCNVRKGAKLLEAQMRLDVAA